MWMYFTISPLFYSTLVKLVPSTGRARKNQQYFWWLIFYMHHMSRATQLRYGSVLRSNSSLNSCHSLVSDCTSHYSTRFDCVLFLSEIWKIYGSTVRAEVSPLCPVGMWVYLNPSSSRKWQIQHPNSAAWLPEAARCGFSPNRLSFILSFTLSTGHLVFWIIRTHEIFEIICVLF